MLPVVESGHAPSPGGTDSTRDQVAVRAVARLFAFWDATGDEAAQLLAVSTRTWARMKAGAWTGELSQDQRQRASSLVGLYKGLHLYFSDELADRWVKMPNTGPLFRGEVPLQFMLKGGLPAIMSAREYIDAVRGGV